MYVDMKMNLNMLRIVGVKSTRIVFKIEFFLNRTKQLHLFGEAGKISLLEET